MGDIVGVLTFIGGSDVVGRLLFGQTGEGINDDLPGGGIDDVLVSEYAGLSVRSDGIEDSAKHNKGGDYEIERGGELHAVVILFGVWGEVGMFVGN